MFKSLGEGGHKEGEDKVQELAEKAEEEEM